MSMKAAFIHGHGGNEVVTVGARPASLSQPSPFATKSGAAPTIGMTPTRTGTDAV